MNTTTRTTKRPFKPDEVRQIRARFNGTCRKCGDPVRSGEIINYSKATGTVHVICRRLEIERWKREAEEAAG